MALEKALKLLLKLNQPFGCTLQEMKDEVNLSERQVLRHISTFRSVSFVIESQNGRYKIEKEYSPYNLGDLLHFTDEESEILTNAIHSIEATDKFRTRLINKLYALYNTNRIAKSITKGDTSKIVLKIINAIQEKKRVRLVRYHSSNSGNIRDRIVEPISFTTHYHALWAYDTEDSNNKLFRISRIEGVTPLEEIFRYDHLHKAGKIDIFRISSDKQIHVKLSLSLLAKNLLEEEYPMSEKFITRKDDNNYFLETEVSSFSGISRFIMGLPGEVEVLTPQALQKHLETQAKKIFKNTDAI